MWNLDNRILILWFTAEIAQQSLGKRWIPAQYEGPFWTISLHSGLCQSNTVVSWLVTYGSENPLGKQRWDWHCRGGLSVIKYLDTERQLTLQRALNSCTMWWSGYQNGGTNGAFCAVESWRGWGVQRRTQQLGSGINEDSKGTWSPGSWNEKGGRKEEIAKIRNALAMSRELQKMRKQLRDHWGFSCWYVSWVQYGKMCRRLDQQKSWVLIQSTETAKLLQLVRSFNKGKERPALLGGLFRVAVLTRLSKQ